MGAQPPDHLPWGWHLVKVWAKSEDGGDTVCWQLWHPTTSRRRRFVVSHLYERTGGAEAEQAERLRLLAHAAEDLMTPEEWHTWLAST